jgi:hypothetical protein
VAEAVLRDACCPHDCFDCGNEVTIDKVIAAISPLLSAASPEARAMGVLALVREWQEARREADDCLDDVGHITPAPAARLRAAETALLGEGREGVARAPGATEV